MASALLLLLLLVLKLMQTHTIMADTASDLTSVTSDGSNYVFQRTGIAWPTDKQKYKPTQYTNAEIVPPPNWAVRYPQGKYTDEYPAPDLSNMERFMVWMHVAALPDFRKIWARNDHDDLQAGRWRISIDMSKGYLCTYLLPVVKFEANHWFLICCGSYRF